MWARLFVGNGHSYGDGWTDGMARALMFCAAAFVIVLMAHTLPWSVPALPPNIWDWGSILPLLIGIVFAARGAYDKAAYFVAFAAWMRP